MARRDDGVGSIGARSRGTWAAALAAGVMVTAALQGKPLHFGVARLLTPPPEAGADFAADAAREAG